MLARVLPLLAVTIAALVAAAPAQALSASRNGGLVRLEGAIQMGDDYKFRDAVKDAPAGLVVEVDSGGGFIEPAQEIARLIRKNGWTVRLDAARARCSSACTIIFAAGTQRIYLNGAGLSDGVQDPKGFRGLGYHEGGNPLSLQKSQYSGGATGHMIGLYYEMGARAAVDLVTKAPPNRLYRVSGPTAVSLGLATSAR